MTRQWALAVAILGLPVLVASAQEVSGSPSSVATGAAATAPAATATMEDATVFAPAAPAVTAATEPLTGSPERPFVELQMGPGRIPPGPGVVMRSRSFKPAAFRGALLPLLHALVPGAPTTTTTGLEGPLDLLVHWSRPSGKTVTAPLVGGAFPVPAPEPGLHLFHLTYSDPALGLELRIPESPRRFRLKVEGAEQEAFVVGGSGSAEGAFGEKISIWVDLRGTETVRAATLFWRTSAGAPVASREMSVRSTTDGVTRYEISVPHPLGKDTTIHYWILLENHAGKRSEYGSPEAPYRILVREPDDLR
ncbi:MAG: hypothetical protein HY814_12535 [Candidatus Riflebacteria bacterium]|nr:hypothetical protein [Candidatus Riflebacteria bacterium]